VTWTSCGSITNLRRCGAEINLCTFSCSISDFFITLSILGIQICSLVIRIIPIFPQFRRDSDTCPGMHTSHSSCESPPRTIRVHGPRPNVFPSRFKKHSNDIDKGEMNTLFRSCLYDEACSSIHTRLLSHTLLLLHSSSIYSDLRDYISLSDQKIRDYFLCLLCIVGQTFEE
jgi:hypothetical protein